MLRKYKDLGQWSVCDTLRMVEIEGETYLLTRGRDEYLIGQQLSGEQNKILTGNVKRFKPVFGLDSFGNYCINGFEPLDG